jgi:hypothetical protein
MYLCIYILGNIFSIYLYIYIFIYLSIYLFFYLYIYYILGIITTIAGNGSVGYSGDGGLATSATLNGPCGVAIDTTTGDVYIADSNNHRIRLITNSSGNNYIYIYLYLGIYLCIY